MSRLKKNHPRLKKFPVGGGVFGDQIFHLAEGGGQVSRLKKKNTQSSKSSRLGGVFLGTVVGVEKLHGA